MAKGYSRYSLFNAGTDRAGHPHADRDLRLQGPPSGGPLARSGQRCPRRFLMQLQCMRYWMRKHARTGAITPVRQAPASPELLRRHGWRPLSPGGQPDEFGHRQKSLNLPGDNSVYRTVC